MLQRTVDLPFPIDLHRTFFGIRRGQHDPTCRFDDSGVWRASRSPAGPVTVRIVSHGDQIEATADKVVDRLRRLFVAPVTNYIAGQASVVDDVVAQPSRYAYPLATVLAVVALHPELDRDRLHQQITSTKELRPTNDFDRELLASL